jgi:hypothetical protein
MQIKTKKRLLVFTQLIEKVQKNLCTLLHEEISTLVLVGDMYNSWKVYEWQRDVSTLSLEIICVRHCSYSYKIDFCSSTYCTNICNSKSKPSSPIIR